ncbi:inositol 1,4,5-triphosphate receptor associated 2-like isoform X2 [Onthophagus taurus]|nr:uncharacterized protein LOC111413285 isoform X2 [Onthophagus taurus]
MSDGSPTIAGQDEPFEIFPSLPDPVLEKMGLLGDSPKERLNEEELEQKFVALALAFRIDSATIQDRCLRQKRYRDQTEKNLLVEIDRLVDRAYKLQQLCVDAETTELLTDLLGQVDVVMKAASHATISAERFGAVQHEDRLAQSVQLMINHVTLLKQQRDSARKHLQYTKKVLQNTPHNLDESQKSKSPQGTPLLSKRRASIATITQKGGSFDSKMRTRRPSEMAFRTSALPRISRPSRLELGVDLVKIKEGTTEGLEIVQNEERKEEIIKEPELLPNDDIESSQIEQNYSELTPREKVVCYVKKFNEISTIKYKNWTENGSITEILIVATFICFTLGFISLGNVLIELEYAKYSLNNQEYSIIIFFKNLIGYFSKLFDSRSVVT